MKPSPTTQLDRARRRRDGAINTMVGLVAVPTILQFWTPWRWIAVWAAVYLLSALHGIFNPRGLALEVVEQWWTVGISIAMCFLPVSAAIWSDLRETRWMVGIVLVVHVAMESSTLPHLELPNWRIGPSMTLPAMTFSHLTLDGFGLMDAALTVAFGVAMFMLISAGQDGRRRNRDVYQKQQALEVEIGKARYLADHDALTGVLNRRGVASEIEKVVGQPASIVMFDADRFKVINDTTGHSVGDAVLVQMAIQLGRRLGEAWTVGRLGGDEFVAVAPGHPELPAEVTNPMVCEVHDGPFFHRFDLRLSGGILRTNGETTVDRVLAQVGFAMRAAKRQGGGLVRFDGAVQGQWERASQLDVAVSGQDPQNSIIAFGQMIVRDGRATGCELLARWRCSDGVVRGPGEFLSLLVDKAMMGELNRRMIGEAVRFAARFNDVQEPFFVSVNVNAQHLAAPDLAEDIIKLLHIYRIPENRLMIEITESERLESVDWRPSVERMRAHGVLLAIDDLGAGYSSIERMASLPISHLKFDRVFAEQARSPLGEIMQGIVRYATETGVEVVAEGIETPDQVEAMADIGIDLLQGFLFSRPAPLDELEQTVRTSFVQPKSVAADPTRSESEDWAPLL